jgi:hypothetical protein
VGVGGRFWNWLDGLHCVYLNLSLLRCRISGCSCLSILRSFAVSVLSTYTSI